MVVAYVERGVAMATDSGVAAWSYEPELWGRCGQGPDEASALAALTRVRRTLTTAAPDLIHSDATAVWTTTRLLRRLAWHEPAELHPMRAQATP